MTHLERLYAALWVSEVWNLAWHERGRIHYKARAIEDHHGIGVEK